jgi:hypothetical protein
MRYQLIIEKTVAGFLRACKPHSPPSSWHILHSSTPNRPRMFQVTLILGTARRGA